MQGRPTTARRGISRWFAAVALWLLVVPAAAAGQTYEVMSPDDVAEGSCGESTCTSLRAALEAAAAADTAVTIRLPDHGRPYSQNPRFGTLVIRSSVRLVGDGADRTVITGGESDRTFQVGDLQSEAAPEVVMEHLQVAGGREPFDDGGNIANFATLRLDHV
ncbi:MAG TPA: hypothetical protein VFZ00_25930, partial [Solirubrobacter sp.]|nr:hypothetical protein [Solirubrobacter sp.]